MPKELREQLRDIIHLNVSMFDADSGSDDILKFVDENYDPKSNRLEKLVSPMLMEKINDEIETINEHIAELVGIGNDKYLRDYWDGKLDGLKIIKEWEQE